MSSDLTWNAHIEVIKKANKRLYFLVLNQLKRAKVPLKELVLFYTCVRSVIDSVMPYLPFIVLFQST